MESNNHRCRLHRQSIKTICRSPHCGYFRQLCPRCKHDYQQHNSHLIDLEYAVQQAKRIGNLCIVGLQGLRANRKQQFEEKMNLNQGLREVQDRLNELQKVILQKLNSLRIKITKQFEAQVVQRLHKIDDTIQKSQRFLQRQVGLLQQRNYQNLSMFFKQDFLYNLQYYKSYINEIFQKKIRLFNQSLKNDKIFHLVTNFQQNLSSIFAITQQVSKQQNIASQAHMFTNQHGQANLYSVTKELVMRKQPIASINRIVFSNSNKINNPNYTWRGIPKSVFYPAQNCYYIIGQGNKVSTTIVKYQLQKGPDHGFTSIDSMQTARAHFGVCVLGNQIYIIGGQNQKQECLSYCQKIVPQYKNKIYLVHSLNQKSSRHNIITYKDKYILKFGGISTPINLRANRTLQAHPQIYSLETEEWAVLPLRQQDHMSIGLFPSIISGQNKNMLLILGGNTVEPSYGYRPLFQLKFDLDTQGLNKVKIRKANSRVLYSTLIFNSTVALDKDESNVMFVKKEQNSEVYEFQKLKIQNS